jgi:hypothetical protein
MRIADAAGCGALKPNPEDGLADFVVLRERSPFEGPA